MPRSPLCRRRSVTAWQRIRRRNGTEYNPANSELSDTYTLTQYDGLSYAFDATYGDVLTESLRHNNTLTFDRTALIQTPVWRSRSDSTAPARSPRSPTRTARAYFVRTTRQAISFRRRSRWERHPVRVPRRRAAFPRPDHQCYRPIDLERSIYTSGRLTQMTDVEGNSATLSLT